MKVYCNIESLLLRDYLHYLFAYEDGAFSVFRDKEFGKYLCAMVHTSDTPPPKPTITDSTVIFTIPPRVHDLFTKQFLYIRPGDYKRIEDRLKTDYNIDFDKYLYEGLKLGIQRKKVIENFIIHRKLVNKIGDVEALKKRGYRDDLKKLEKLTRQLINRADYQSRLIQKSIQEFENTLAL